MFLGFGETRRFGIVGPDCDNSLSKEEGQGVEDPLVLSYEGFSFEQIIVVIRVERAGEPGYSFRRTAQERAYNSCYD
jgi:hypothetical protein